MTNLNVYIDSYGRYYKALAPVNYADVEEKTVSAAFYASLPEPPIYRDIFYASEGAEIVKIRNRLFVGASFWDDGDRPNIKQDWLDKLLTWPTYSSTASILSPVGRIALTTASRTSDLDPADANTTQITIGTTAFGINDNTTAFLSAYGFYGEGRVYPGVTGTAFAAELEAINLYGEVGPGNPYHDLFLSGSQALRLGSGGGETSGVYSALSAISIVDNGAFFLTGLNFSATSIAGTDGVTGFGNAISLARGHLISWFYKGEDTEGHRGSFITSVADSNSISLQFNDGGLAAVGDGSALIFTIEDTVANPTRFITTRSAASPQAPGILARGTDGSNINLGLYPGGSGQIETNAPVQSAAVAGAGGSVPATVETFMQITVNNTTYAIPLFNIHA